MTDDSGRTTGYEHASVPFYRDVRVLAVLAQVVVVAVVLLVGYLLLSNLARRLDAQGLVLSFDFLGLSAGFEITESLIPFDTRDTYTHALLVGLINTLMVSLLGIFLATVLGLAIGIARLSSNWLVNKLALAYVELFRNTPLLVQLLVIYFVVFLIVMPPVRDSIALPAEIYISQRGLYMPRPELAPDGAIWLVITTIAVFASISLWFFASRREAEGRPTHHMHWIAVGVLVLVPLVTWFIIPGGPVMFEDPQLGRFNFEGGLRFSPQFAALTLGLALYTGAFVAEIIRGGIEAVSKGQREAAHSVGLTDAQTLRLVVLPQALRIIIPPTTSQYLNLIKNSSLALAIGYSDLFNVSRTIAENTTQPITVMVIVMGFYLVISLLTSLLMNIYNRAVQIKER
jgi:general L-amino acid transport system permease protein